MAADFLRNIQLILLAHEKIRASLDMKMGNKLSHNKLERSRRAHLRRCMDELKVHLHSISPGTRITTQVILRSARNEIKKNRALDAQLERVLVRFRHKYDIALETYRQLHVQKIKLNAQIRQHRNSGGSECSIAQTVSDESICCGNEYNAKASSSTELNNLTPSSSQPSSSHELSCHLKSMIHDKDSIYEPTVTSIHLIPSVGDRQRVILKSGDMNHGIRCTHSVSEV